MGKKEEFRQGFARMRGIPYKELDAHFRKDRALQRQFNQEWTAFREQARRITEYVRIDRERRGRRRTERDMQHTCQVCGQPLEGTDFVREPGGGFSHWGCARRG